MVDRRDRCARLRSKGMFVSGKEDRSSVLPFDATCWWCSWTQTAVGPDDGPCDSEACSDETRACHERRDPS